MNILMCIRFIRVKIECKNVYSYRIKFNLEKGYEYLDLYEILLYIIKG